MTDTRTIHIPSHVMLREVGGETVLLNLDTETYFGLDEVGTQMLRELREGASVEETVERILTEFDVDRATLSRDLEELLDALAARGLIEWASAGRSMVDD